MLCVAGTWMACVCKASASAKRNWSATEQEQQRCRNQGCQSLHTGNKIARAGHQCDKCIKSPSLNDRRVIQCVTLAPVHLVQPCLSHTVPPHHGTAEWQNTQSSQYIFNVARIPMLRTLTKRSC